MDVTDRQWIKQLIEANNRVLAKLIEDMSASLQREVADTRVEIESLRQELRQSVERLEATGKRQSTFISSGTLAIGALKRDATLRDSREARRDARMRDVRVRLRQLESGSKRRSAKKRPV